MTATGKSTRNIYTVTAAFNRIGSAGDDGAGLPWSSSELWFPGELNAPVQVTSSALTLPEPVSPEVIPPEAISPGPAKPTPEPSSLFILLVGAGAIWIVRRRKHTAAG